MTDPLETLRQEYRAENADFPSFIIEQYETHVQRYRVQAETPAEAINMLYQGKAEPIEGALEFIQVCEDRGLSVEDQPEIARQLNIMGVSVNQIIPSIRRIELQD